MKRPVHQCQPSKISALISGRLSDAECSAFEAHLDGCDTCRDLLDAAVASHDEWSQVRSSLNSDGLNPASSDQKHARIADLDLSFYQNMLTPSDDPQMLGRIGSYEIGGLLGHGGMGVVFKGFDGTLNRYVAIKMLAPHFAASGSARQRFEREAQAAAAVVHEHVMAIHAVSQWQGTPYLVMPFVKGVSLQKRIEDQGPLQLRELLRIGMQVASGLAAAHAQGLIHRDVKPSNILMEAGVDRVVLADFGLARAVDDVRLTRTDTLVGTPQYMSPEQTNDQALDFRTDLFSLGSVLYEAATGRPAFQAVTSYGVLRKINDHQPAQIQQLNPDIPDWFVSIISQLMAKNPDDRYQSAEEVATLLQQCLSHVEQPHLTELPASLIAQKSTSFPFLWRFVMSGILLTTVLGISSFLMTETPEPVAKPAAQPQEVAGATKYTSAQEAYRVGAAFYNSRNFKAAREPFEAALVLAKDDKEMKLKAYGALIPSYRLIPEFEPFQEAAEYVLSNHHHDAHRSITRRSYLSFAFNRGQMENLVKRYDERLAKDANDWLALYMLSEICSNGSGLSPSVEHSKRAIELIKRLTKVEAKRFQLAGKQKEQMSAAEAVKISREKGRLAGQYVRAKDYKNAAKLYEEIAPLDPTTHAWNLKEAANAMLKLDNKKAALRLALAAEEVPAEARNDQLTHFFERHMGDIFMQLDKPKQAIPHYRIAVEKTNIEGYVKDTKASLQEAIEKAEK